MRKVLKHLWVLILLFSLCSNSQYVRCKTSVDYDWLQSNAPDRYQRFIDLENFTTNYINGQIQGNNRLINNSGIIIIPVVVHVLHHGESIGSGYNISLSQIQSQIDVLNEDFRRLNPDAINTPSAFAPFASDFGIQFKLACVDPSGNSTDGIVRKQKSVETFITNIPLRPQDRTTNEEGIGVKT
jgi:hypothetical protein